MNRVLLAFSVLMLVLASCGGGDDVDPKSPPPPTLDPLPTPTLDPAVRVGSTPGTVGNPFVMVLQATDTISVRVPILLESLGASAEAITPDADLREDLGMTLDLLRAGIDATFGVMLFSADWDAIRTVDDLIDTIYARVGAEVTRTLYARTALFVDVRFVDSPGEALTALCDSTSGIVSIAWLNGAAAVAAEAENCGEAALLALVAENPVDLFAGVSDGLILPEATAEATAESTAAPTDNPDVEAVDAGALTRGDEGVLIVSRALGTTDLAALGSRPFCRIGLEDFYSWFVPYVFLEEAGITPSEIIEFTDRGAMFEAVATEQCAGAGFSLRQLSAFSDTPYYEEVRIVRTSPEFPHAVLMYPLEVELGVRISLNTHLTALALDPVEGRYLRLILGQDAFTLVEDDTFPAVREFLARTGYNLALLGE